MREINKKHLLRSTRRKRPKTGLWKTKLYCKLILCTAMLTIPQIGSASEFETTTLKTDRVQSQITGTVSDSQGPLPGATVIVKGTSNGVQTDFDGNYTIDVSDGNATLVFSYVGYATQEIAINGQSIINVTLVEDTQNLEEVVVLGYTTRKKGEVTGSVSTIDSKAIEQSSNKDIAKSLAGRAQV